MNTKENIILIGSSGHCKIIIDIIEKENIYNILGLIDSFKNAGEEVMGYKILGNENCLPQIMANHPPAKLLIAIGDNWNRRKVYNRILEILPSAQFATAIHPTATIGKNVKIGEGTVIMAAVIISPDSIIGNHAYINTKASIGHESVMHDFSSLGPGVTTGGNVEIGAYSAISIGATIKHKIKIGEHCIIGAASLILKDCTSNTMVYGVPAREVKKREAGEKYL